MLTPQTFTALFAEYLPEPQAALLSGMVFGVKASMPRDFYTALKTTGTIHMIALSGMNISILINILGTLLMFFGRRVSAVLTIIWIGLFVWFVGPSASIVRASIMGSLGLIGVYLGRQYYSLLALVFAAITMLFWQPSWLFEIGFQLSFLSTLGIVLLGGSSSLVTSSASIKQAKSLLKLILQPLWLDLRLTLSAQLFTAPVILWNFRQLSLAAPLTNALVGWVVQPITILGFVAAASGFFVRPVGQLISWLAYPLLTYFIWVVEWTATLPLASVSF